jgi:hypothetical protein
MPRISPCKFVRPGARGALSSCMSSLRCRRTRTAWRSGSALRRSSDSGEPVSWSATSGSWRTLRCTLRPSPRQPRSRCYRTGRCPQTEPQLAINHHRGRREGSIKSEDRTQRRDEPARKLTQFHGRAWLCDAKRQPGQRPALLHKPPSPSRWRNRSIGGGG